MPALLVLVSFLRVRESKPCRLTGSACLLAYYLSACVRPYLPSIILCSPASVFVGRAEKKNIDIGRTMNTLKEVIS